MGSRDTKSEHVDFFSTPIHARFVSRVCSDCLYDAIDKVHCNHPFSSFFVVRGFLNSLLWSILPPIIATRVRRIQPFLLSRMECLWVSPDVEHQYATVLNLLSCKKFKQISYQ